jgi:predicted component of type VI protein secretion system
MQLVLTVLRGPREGKRIPIGIPEFLIGRDPMCHLRPTSKEVHWQQCAILQRGQEAYLRDDSGRGGTLLNGRQVLGGEMELGDGDRLGIGPLEFAVNLQSDPEPPAPRAVPKPPARAQETSPGFSLKAMSYSREILCPM